MERKTFLRKLWLGIDIFWFAGVIGVFTLKFSEYIFLLLPQGRHGLLLLEPNSYLLFTEVVALFVMLSLTLFKIVKWLKGIAKNA